jgi:hypothetical protein
VLDIVAFIIFAVMTYRIVVAAKRESAIFAEFEQSRAFAYTALLFPLGPVVMLLIGIRVPLVGISLCAACYIPSLVLARRVTAGFDGAGTDRVKGANAAAWEAVGTAIAGLTYAAVVLVLVIGAGFLRGPTDA